MSESPLKSLHAAAGASFLEIDGISVPARFSTAEEEAATCGLCLVNLWAPVQWPAYRDPLALLDGASVDIGTDVVKVGCRLHSCVVVS